MTENIRATTTAQGVLDAFYARELGVSVQLLALPGMQVVASRRRDEASWCGFRLPVLALQRSSSTVLSVTASLLPAVRDQLRPGRPPLEVVADVQGAVQSEYPSSQCLLGRALYCEPDAFTPVHFRQVELLSVHDPQYELLHRYFDGPVFATRARDGEVAAWSALKLKGEDVWEISVTTEPAHRGRGLARAVTSAAAEYVLAHGKAPLYVHSEHNLPSARVARSLGFREYARIAYCSVSGVRPDGMW